MQGVIRLNDPTSHGGRVISAAPVSKVMGIAVALVHLKVEGESTPTPDFLCGYFVTTNGVRASSSEHAI